MRSIAVLLLAFAGPAALAQDSMYVGIGLASFRYEEDVNFLLLSPEHVSKSVTAQKLFGGFEFNDYVGIEIAYGKSGDVRASRSENIFDFGLVTSTYETDFTITSLRVIGMLPRDWGVLLGGLGYFSADSDIAVRVSADCCTPFSTGGSISDDGLTTMLGIEWRFGRFGTRYALRLEYEHWDISEVDTSAIGVAFSYGF